MINTVHIRKSDDMKEESESKIHYIPCKINLDGNAKVSQYFIPSSVKGGKSFVLFILVLGNTIIQYIYKLTFDPVLG